ncbi:ribosomal large subunit pseudouridine synthase A [Alcanivorax hongdengensis A-11-3]|uniref:Dual-specificity RNA pseudouridine synthase RluA n=1 Tax=Alcanivorax hongdengensis A-11-3 TaxID=1177179 RepID=L0W830_9GAMM|nr:pseudouridine synthase [Alcanivorax hongdengensis]EKF73061.1 ribosomal large subunit pseudouridine synthase A [Alcanivorax hongdengensis A-11-3]
MSSPEGYRIDPLTRGHIGEQGYYIVPTCHERVGTLYRDANIVLIHKPAYLLSVPGRAPENQDCAFHRLRARFADVRLVHRLDLDTSGIMVFALNAGAQSQLSRLFQQRTVKKHYQAMVHGIVARDEGEIDLPLIADWPNRPLQKVCHDTGKTALTRYRVLERDHHRQRTRLQLSPVTGRSHQLRIHCRELGHPIIGCDMYAPAEIEALSPRLLLHAERLGFNHPTTGLWSEFSAPCPF